MRDYVEVLKLVEAYVPQSVGGANQDDVLRSRLASFANITIDELDREQRWSLSYAEPFFTTSAGVETYAIPYPVPAGPSLLTSPLTITRVYYTNSTGKPVLLERMDQYEIQRVFGEAKGLGASATIPPTGPPVKWALLPAPATAGGIIQGAPVLSIYLYPAPDISGPETAGNFKIRVAGYWKTPPILETLAGTGAASVTLTFSTTGSGSYLLAAGAPASGADYSLNVSIRGAGNPTGVLSLGIDTHITSWTAIAAGTATLSAAAIATTLNSQTYFNSTNWIIAHWPKILAYGMLREIGTYYGKDDMFAIWNARYIEQLEKLRAYEFDRARGIEMIAAAVPGQKGASLRRLDTAAYLDVRGGA